MKKAKMIKRMCLITGILLVLGMAVFLLTNRVPIEKKYSLEDVGEDQAVMVVYYCYYGRTKMAAVTKTGRWKCANITEIKQDNMALLPKDRKENIEIIDEIMSDDSIPFQDSTLKISDNLLEKAINIPRFRYTYIEKYDGYENPGTEPIYVYFAIHGSSEDRYVVNLGQKGETYLRFDINVMRMIHKLDQLEQMRKDVMGNGLD